MSKLVRWSVVAGALALASSCGSGSHGGDGTIQGLAAPSSVSVVTASTGASAGASATPGGHVAPGFAAPAGSDYDTDGANAYVYDPSMEQVSSVNEILTMVSMTAYDEMVNVGQYVALIDESKASAGGESGDQGQSSGGNAIEPARWVVETTRADNDSPQEVVFWVPDINGPAGEVGDIQARMTITEGASDANPFGQFEIDLALVEDGGSISSPAFLGTLETVDTSSNAQGFEFFLSAGDVTQATSAPGEAAERTAVAVNMLDDQSGGVARLTREFRYYDSMNGDSGLISEEYQLAFDADWVLRGKDNDPPVCLSRNDFVEHVWRYNLYYATGASAGQRVELNSGFPFRTAAGDHGYVGYWGLWAPEGVTVNDGDTIYEDQQSDQGNAPAYTVVKAPGKLIQHTRNTLELVDADGTEFEWFDFTQSPPVRFKVVLTAPDFVKVAQWDDPSMSWIDLGVPEVIDTSSLGYLSMYSPALGGQSNYVHGDTFITYFEEQFYAGADLTLYAYLNCLDHGIVGVDAELGDIYLADSLDLNTPHVYTFEGDDLTLYYDTDADLVGDAQVGLASGEAPASGPFTWGMHSGPMIEDTSGLSSPFDIWNQSVFYTYETGHNQWNQYSAVLDSNAQYVQFDAPIQFTYTHATANDRNGDSSFDGKKFMLNYGGPGNFWGIPSTPIDLSGDGNPDRWVPQFSIVDGVVMGPTGVEYALRGIDMEFNLVEDPSGCTGLQLAGAAALVLPDGSSYTAPNIGPMPDLDEAPSVIDGVVQ